MVDSFQKHSLAWRNVRVIMADKDIHERDVLKQKFPGSSILICLFHTLRTIRREITCEKLGITSAQRITALEFIQKLTYAHTEEEYQALYNKFCTAVPKQVLEYFNNNWHSIRNEWVVGIKACCGSFLNTTNNRLESINAKLKQVINRHSSLEEYFFVTLTALRVERDHKAALMLQKLQLFLLIVIVLNLSIQYC